MTFDYVESVTVIQLFEQYDYIESSRHYKERDIFL